MRAISLFVLPLAVFTSLLYSPAAEAQSLRGSRASINQMHHQAVNHDLYFYQTGSGVRKAATAGRFVRLSSNADYKVEGAQYPYVLPTTYTFVTRLARQYRAACGERLVVTSAVRPKSFRLSNSVGKTVHPTGMAVDLRRSKRSSCVKWLRRTLLELEDGGVLNATEERRPPHFHVAVFPRPYEQHVSRMGGKVHVASRANSTTSSKKNASASQTATYRVRQGDSLWSIARRHKTSVNRLKLANNMNGSRILPGQTLTIPGAR